MISFAAPEREHRVLQGALQEAVARVLRSGRSILGEEVSAFEQEIADFAGARFAVGVSSGTDALCVALHALGLGPGDEVVLGAFGFVAAAEAVVRVGGRPVFVDVEPDNLALDAEAVGRAVTPRTRAILSVDLFGVVHDLAPIRAAAPGVPIVEDAAQALGASLAAKTAAPSHAPTMAGALGDAGIFSFFPSKVLGAAGDGGCCITDDPAVASRARRARVHGACATYVWEDRGGNYRLDEIQAAILRVKLRCLPARIERRRSIGKSLAATAARLGARPLVGTRACSSVFSLLAMRIGEGRRDRVIARLRERGVDARVHYPYVLATSAAYLPFCEGQVFPNADRATKELLSIPCHPELSDGEVEQIQAALSEALG
jgi:dTDP-4-amino-4,6-dideoxygalactose transaminase